MKKIKNYVILYLLITIVFLSCNKNVKAMNRVYDFSYTGNVQEFTVPYSGEYMLEVWGAKGGDYNATYTGGKGGYTKGTVTLKKGETIYVYVGGKGTTAVGYHEGGYNGGARSSHRTEHPSGSGGGATDIRLVGGSWNNSASLLSRFIVAGGGGSAAPNGSASTFGAGGYGGGLTGGAGTSTSSYVAGGGGTQTSGGTRKVCGSNQTGLFGKGGDPDVNTDSCFAGAGGGGWYGGGAGESGGAGGGGGSGFVLTADTLKNVPTGYSVTNDYYLKDTVILGGNAEIPNYNGGTMTGNNGDGYARITLLSRDLVIDLNISNVSFDKHFDKEEFDYDIYLIDNTSSVTVSINEPNDNYIYTGVGSFNLADGDTHYVTAIDESGAMVIYRFKVHNSKAKLNNVSFDEFNFNFDENVYEYNLTVSSNVRTATPTVLSNDNTTYEINKLDDLYIGNNKVTINVHETGKVDAVYIFNIVREDFPNKTTKFNYMASVQTFTVPKSGYYKLEVWGASGGNYNATYTGGKGGYSKGVVYLNEGQTLYVYTGGQGTAGTGIRTGGFNGGGNSSGRNMSINNVRAVTATGGGATDIRLVGGAWDNSTSLLSRIIVAGGGGSGASNGTYHGKGGAGGGATGLAGTTTGGSLGYKPGGAGSATSGGTSTACTDTSGASLNKAGSFGKGGAASTITNSCMAGAGGGGWYGGGAGQTGGAAGGGGSGFVLTSASVANAPANYSPTSDYYMSGAVTLDGTKTMPTYDGTGTMTGNQGNGHALITFISEVSPTGELTSIIPSKGTLTPDFSANTTSYTLNLNSEDSYITINAEANNSDTIILGTGDYEIGVGNTQITLTVMSPSGDVTIYQITAKREASNDRNLKTLRINGGSIKDFDPEVEEYTITVPYNVKYLEVEPVKNKVGQSLTFEENIELTSDEKDVTVFVVSEDKMANRMYTVHVKREQTTYLKEIKIFSSVVNIDFIPTKTEYDLEIPVGLYSLNMEAIPYSDKAVAKIEGNGYIEDGPITITVTNDGIPDTVYTLNIVRKSIEKKIYEYPYTGSYQEFIVPVSGRYLLETWGAEGGSFNTTYKGGKGAYAKGVLTLEQSQVLYIFVGGKGTAGIGITQGGYNGGGDSSGRTVQLTPSGGGATDIRTIINATGDWNDRDSLRSRFLVAAGGGAGAWNGSYGGTGGYGGSLVGGDGTSNYNSTLPGKGGTQTAGGVANICIEGNASSYNQSGSYGKGGNASKLTTNCLGGGGGAGWYGGGSGHSNGSGAGGGSSFAYTKANRNNTPSGYLVTDKFQLIDTELIGGNKALPTHDGTSKVIGNSGDGYAKITLLSEVSSNNFLDSISINNEAIADFDTTKLEYNVTLGENDAITNINAVPKDENAQIVGLGDIDIKPGDSTHEIVVTASDGSIRTYTLNIYRTPSSDPTPKDIKLEKVITSLCKLHSSYCNYTFDKDVATYDIVFPYNNNEAELVPVLRSKYQKVEFRFVKDTGNEDRFSGLVTLGSEKIILEIEITSEDEVNTVVYHYTLTKDPDGNNNLASLEVTEPVIPIEDFDPYTYEYYIEVPSSASSFIVNAIPEDNRADVTIIGNTNLKVGMNDCIISVTSANGIKKSYIIHAYKGQDTNVYLSNLEVKNNKNNEVIEMSSIFNKLLNEYTLEVPNDVETINIVATPESGSATITGDGIHNLKTGTNTLDINVSTTGSSDVNTYKLVIYRAKNSNPNLANIEVEDFTLSPAFDKDILEYNVKFEGDISRLNLKITPEESTTTYTIRGNTLIGNYNEITITAIAEDKSYKVYKIYAIKDLSENNFLSTLNVIGTTESYTPSFDKNEMNYTLSVPENVSQIEVEGIPEDKLANVIGNGKYTLQKGSNTISIVVTSESGDVRTYTLNITRDKNDDLTLKSVTNNIGSEVIKFDDNSRGYDYLINVQYEINQLSINGIPNANTSVVTGNGTYNLVVGNNDITLRVDSEAGNYKEYIVRIVRDLSTNDDLDFLFVEEGGLSPNFNETTISYDVKIPYNKSDVHITAIPEDSNATVDIIGDTTNLEVGATREIKVVVTAQKGNKKTYILEVVRQEDTTQNLGLETLETNRGALTPTFNPDTLNYEISVENDITDIEIIGPAFSSDVKVLGLGTYNLKVGKNSIPIFVVSNTDGIQRDYQIVVTRKKSNDATLASLVVKGHTLTPKFNSNTDTYSLNTSNELLEFTTIKTSEEEATYEVIGNKDFVTGENIVTIRVTAPDGETTKDYILNVNKEASKNNNLASLSVEGYVLVPVFHKGVTFYVVDVPNNVNNILINGTPEDKSATISGIGLKKVNPGENYFNIEVTSEIGTIKTYTILVTREASDNNYLASITIPNYELSPNFDKLVNDYEVIVPFTENTIDIYAVAEDINASVTGVDTYTLIEGENLIPITVTSESGKVRAYNIKVIKESPVSVYLNSLEVKNYELDTEFNKEIFEYFITVPNEVNSLDLAYTLEDTKATAVVTGNENFVVGMNEIHITVTRVVSDSETLEQDYVIYVNKQMSTNNYLDYITVTDGTFTEEFVSTNMNYTVLVNHDISEVTINAMPQDKNSKIISGTGVVTLEVGNNEVLIKVRSSVGIIRTYTLNIIREASDNNYLSSLKVMNGIDEFQLTPVFNKETLEYTINVDSDLEFVDIVGTLEEPTTATVTGLETVMIETGTSSFEVVVTSESGLIRVYKIDIIKAPSTNNYALNIVPSSGNLNPEFNKEHDTYNLELEDVSSLSFDVTLESSKASVTGHEIKPVDEGASVRIITITAEDGSTRDYTINITRPSKSEARLENLEIDRYPFEFNPDTFTYNIQVSNSKKVLLESEITAIPKDENATVNMMGDLKLADGIVNIYVIEVIAKDGYTTQTYTLNITRDSAEYTLRSNKYEIVRFEDSKEEDYVIGIQPSTIISDFKNNFENSPEDLKVYLETSEVADTELTATALVLKLEKNGRVYDTLRIIVRGDLTKDGKVNITDQVKMINYVGRTTTFDKYQMLAGDLTFDGKVNITDQVKIINYVGRTISDLNNKPTS